MFGLGLMIRVLNKLLKVTQSTESTSQTFIAKTLMAVVNPSIYLLYEDRCLYHKPAEIHGLLECVRTGGSSRVELPSAVTSATTSVTAGILKA